MEGACLRARMSEVGESQSLSIAPAISETRQIETRTLARSPKRRRVDHFLVVNHCLDIPNSTNFTMARGIEGNEIATPRVPKLQKSTSSASQSAKQQKSILGFFQRKTAPASSPAAPSDVAAASSPPPQSSPAPANFNGKENGAICPYPTTSFKC